MDEQNPDLWYEYETLGEGKLRPIIWDQNKNEKGAWSDVRHSSKEHDPSDKLIFKEDSVLWVAYSPVQWSVAYHKQIKQDAKLRAQRMTKVECRGFAQDEKDRKSTRLNSSHVRISYAVLCLKTKNKKKK